VKTTERISAAFARAAREDRAVFVAYLTAGDPNLRATVALARVLEKSGADVLELGVPFSDPVADGVTLQRAAARALAAGTTLDGVFAAAKEIRSVSEIPLVLFSYANPLHARGFGRAFREAKKAGFDAVLLTDVPVEELDAALPEVRRSGLDPVLLVSPTSDAGRMRAAAARSRGFLYVVSRTGTTGERTRLAGDLETTVSRARRAAKGLPIAVGFGIASAADARRVAAIADGIVVGSALVACAERNGRRAASAVGALARSIAKACRR